MSPLTGALIATKIIHCKVWHVKSDRVVGWLATRKTLPSAQLSPAKVPPSIPPSTNLLPFFGTNSRPRPGEAPVDKAAAIPSTVANAMTNWEDKLDDILGSEGEESDKAKKLLAMFS